MILLLLKIFISFNLWSNYIFKKYKKWYLIYNIELYLLKGQNI